MLFNDVIGQNNIKQQLLEMIQQNRLSHALLFLGNEGSGNLALALAFAQLISLLPASKKTGGGTISSSFLPSKVEEIDDWMKAQPAFSKANELVHPDIHFSYPVVTRKGVDKPVATDYITEWRSFINNDPYGNVYDWLQSIGAENKQGNISVEECNAIMHKLSFKSFESEFKVLVMWMPEFLGKSGNRLLKLIEEPTENTVFILVAESDEKILPTILSRCQLVKFPLLSNKEIADGLMKDLNVEHDHANQVAAISEGNFREAKILVHSEEKDWIAVLSEWLKFIIRRMISDQLKWVEETTKTGREKQKNLLLYFIHLIELSIRMKVIGDEIAATEKEKDFAHRLNKICSVSQHQVIIEEVDKAIYHIERNANPKLLFLSLSIKLYYIIQDKTLILAD